MKIKHFDQTYDVSLRFREYTEGNIAVCLETASGEPFATLSVNIEGVQLGPNEFVAKTYSENIGLNEQLIAAGYFRDTGRTVVVGFAGFQPILEVVKRA